MNTSNARNTIVSTLLILALVMALPGTEQLDSAVDVLTRAVAVYFFSPAMTFDPAT